MAQIKNAVTENLKYLHSTLETPALLIDEARLSKNLSEMQDHAGKHSVKIRPHCKTHKSEILARRQTALGACGITVAKLAEAEHMAANGLEDIFIANQITQPRKFTRLRDLHRRINLVFGLDNLQQIALLEPFFKSEENPLNVRIEIDCGFGRCGLKPGSDALIALAKAVDAKPWLFLEGLFTHAGQAYAATSVEHITQIAQREAEDILLAQSNLANNGIEVATISVGSTPTARHVVTYPGITEVRPGNYIFYDAIQQALGVCGFESCSLFVLATVISQPEPDKIVCDAGSKALNVDRGAHAAEVLKSFGTLVNQQGIISSVSEEHGVILLHTPAEIPIGSPLLIIPNHACVVVNLFDSYTLVGAEKSVQTLPISCRGLSQ